MSEFGEKFDIYLSKCAENQKVRHVEQVYHSCSRCESPIEALLAAAIYEYGQIGLEQVFFCLNDRGGTEPSFDEAVFIFPQAKIGTYRVDFLIVDASVPFEVAKPRRMIVECDGHDFHERTKEQARRDKKRDRFFQGLGYRVLRFTGSEIWADPDACAEEVFSNLATNDGVGERA